MIFTIYLITNKVNGKVYVGQTRMFLSKRWRLHKRDAKKDNGMLISRAIDKYGPESFTIHTIQLSETAEEADFLEGVWISLYDSRNPQTGYNIRGGGWSPKMDDRTKAKLSEATKKSWAEGRLHGRVQSEETRQKISETLLKKGVLRSDILSEQVLFLWNNEVSVKDLARHFLVSGETIRERIRRSGLEYRPFSHKRGKSGSSFDLSAAQKLRSAGLSYEKIAQRTESGYTAPTVRLKLNAAEEGKS